MTSAPVFSVLIRIEIGFLVTVSYAAGAGSEKSRMVSAYWER